LVHHRSEHRANTLHGRWSLLQVQFKGDSSNCRVQKIEKLGQKP
jgi:hypothetical protein